MLTKLLFKPTDNISRSVAHIYEHEFINGFYNFLDTNHINPGIIGWINGDTFDDGIFIEAGFYSKKISQLFDDFTKNYSPQYGSLQKSLSQIGLECGRTHTVKSSDMLKQQLALLDQLDWIDLHKDTSIHQFKTVTKLPSPIQTKIMDKPPKEITLGIFIETNSHNLIGLFSRLSILILDMIVYRIAKSTPIYITDTSPLLYADGIAQRTVNVKIYPNTAIASLEKTLRKTMSTITLDEIYKPALTHLEVFSSEQLWVFQAIDNYRTSGVIASGQAIIKQATRQNIAAVINNLDCYIDVA